MKTKVIGSVLFSLIAALGMGITSAHAGTIEVDFSGHVSVQDDFNHFGGLFHNGESYSASFTYEPSTLPDRILSGGNTQRGEYGPPLSFTVNVGGYVFQSKNVPPYAPNTPAMYVYDATAGLGSDGFVVIADPIVPDFLNFPDAVNGQMDFFATDPTGAGFSSTVLPLTLPADQFSFGGGSLVFFSTADNQQAFLTGSVETVTVTQTESGAPEPSTWLLLITGAGMFAWQRGRRGYSVPNASRTLPGTPPLRG